MSQINGTAIVRQGSSSYDVVDDTQELVMFIGVLRVPKGHFKGEHQYVVTGEQDVLRVHMDSAVELDLKSQAKTVDGLILSRIWKVEEQLKTHPASADGQTKNGFHVGTLSTCCCADCCAAREDRR